MTTPVKPVLIDVPMPIVTPRLILRAPAPSDGPAMNAAKLESLPELVKWMPWAKTPSTIDDDEATAREAAAKFIMRTDLMMLIFERDTGRLVGGTGLHRFDWDKRHFEIGYWVRTSAHGKGYATEATNALLRFAFNALSATRVEINHADGNDASAAVIRKLGFVKEGVLRNATTLPGGTSVDKHVYSRLNLDNLPALDVRWGPT
jgi:RimJ/RimL family protein N-acetyltransferase